MDTLSPNPTMPENGKGKTRLMITKMILENFKSYAGSQTIGPFHKRFSSVVGPNGRRNIIYILLQPYRERQKSLLMYICVYAKK